MGSRATRKVQALQAVLALLAALLAAGFALFIVFGVIFWFDEPGAPLASVFGEALMIGYGGVIWALPVVLAGTPVLYVAFRRLGWFLARQSAAGGAVLGALVVPAQLIVELIVRGEWAGLFSLEVLGFGLFGALPGAVGGLVFWWIAARPLAPAKKHDGLPETAAPQSRG